MLSLYELISILFIKEIAMYKIMFLLVCFQMLAFASVSFGENGKSVPGKQTVILPRQPSGTDKPLVVIYTLSTCPHCREAKEYLIKNKIPFINREVDSDDEQMAALMKIYDSMGVPEAKRGVPLFVIGNTIKLQGFNSEKLQNALNEVTAIKK